MPKTNKHRWYMAGSGLLTLNALAFTIPMVANAETSDTAVSVTISPVITAYSSGPTVTLGTILPDATGRQSIASDAVSASTNNATGLNITLQQKSAASTSMVSGSNTIVAGSGTPASPATLGNGSWGWRVDSLGGFGAGPTSSANSAAPSSLTFAGIPANGSPYQIKNSTTNGSTSASVWYSARVNTSQPTGAYTSTVTYTFTVNP